MLTPERLRAIRERCERATEGPWKAEPEVDKYGYETGSYWLVMGKGELPMAYEFDRAEDAEFCAHARDDVPALVAEVERLHRFVDRVREQIKAWRTRAEEESHKASRARDVFDELSYGASSRAWFKAEEELQALLDELEASRRAECGVATTRADAEFIAHAREDVPALIAEVERLWEENRKLRQELQKHADVNSDL